MELLLFILINAALFVRPAEIVPALESLPIYNILMLIGLAASAAAVLGTLNGRALSERPITICVLGVQAMVVLSNVVHFDLWTARERGIDFFKIVLYYLLLVATLTTPSRLNKFLVWLTIFIVFVTSLSLLHYHGYINIPALEALERLDVDEESGEEEVILQLRSTGLFNDPNDFCLILVVGVMFSLYRLTSRTIGPTRALWSIPLAIFFYAFFLTRSRGGMLGLMTGLMTFMIARFGWRRSIPVGLIVLPGLLLMAGGRQARLSTGEDTAQQRLQLWSEGFALLARAPLTGIGAGNYGDAMYLVAHNSFVHSFTELGLIGGAFFVSAFYLPLWSLSRLGAKGIQIDDPQMRHLRPYLMGAVAGYAAGILSLSRCYITPTYMVPGLAAAYLQSVSVNSPEVIPKLSVSLMMRMIIVSILALAGIYGFTRLSVQWN